MVLSWKRKEGIKYKYLSTGDHNMANDKRIQIESSNEENSSTLVVTLAKEADVGEYICEVSSNPPATLRHQVSIIGKSCLSVCLSVCLSADFVRISLEIFAL